MITVFKGWVSLEETIMEYSPFVYGSITFFTFSCAALLYLAVSHMVYVSKRLPFLTETWKDLFIMSPGFIAVIVFLILQTGFVFLGWDASLWILHILAWCIYGLSKWNDSTYVA